MAIPPDINMVSLRSSNVDAVGFDEESKTLFVTFKSGASYAYSNVDEATFQDLLTSNSPGRYVNQWLRTSHEARRV